MNKPTVDEVLDLVDRLSPEEQMELMEQLRIRWLRRSIDEGDESMRQYGGRSAEDVYASLQEDDKAKKRSL